MTIGELFQTALPAVAPPPHLAGAAVAGLDYDSRRIQPGYLYFAFAGARADGRDFAGQAMAKGALAVVSELPRPAGFAGPWIAAAHGRQALARLARAFYGAPDQRLHLTGYTGTNGKTTAALLTDAALRHAGAVTGLVGTIEYRIAEDRRRAVNTTPESLDLVRLFVEMIAREASHCTLEVSSHALALGRVHGFDFHTVAFTNLTRDHLDFHGTMEAYFEAKQLLFQGAGGAPPRWAVINGDDEWGRRIRCSAGTEVLTYGLEPGSSIRAVRVQSGFDGLRFEVEHPAGRTRVASALSGQFNVYNLLAAFGAGLSFGLDPETLAEGLASLTAVPGRFERIDEGQPFLVVVDYAHSDDALRNVLRAARALEPRRVITVFGCGGDRDRSKRPLMGQAAAEQSDLVIVTSDNPRGEDPLAIINDALVGVRRTDTRHLVEPDRLEAIRRALTEAGANDAVVLAGKGHETYQVLRDRTIDFDDRVEARRILRDFGYRREARHAD
jgi:UDP-N-acetylmuramoyl-L-alanyl-D-glutamate--2,6-diaminopimelate ligase